MPGRWSRWSFPLLLAVLLVTPSSALQSASGTPDRVRALIDEGHLLAEEEFRNEEALKRFEEALRLDPGNYEALWAISRTHIDIGEHLPVGTDEEKETQLRRYETALDYAEQAVIADPAGSMGYTRRAIANGRIALFRGVWESLDLVKKVKADIEKAIELDPSNSVAYYILGRTHAKVCEKPKIVRWPLGLSWASMEAAAENYEKAVALRPEFIMYRLDAARAYVELGEKRKARVHLDAIPSISNQDEDDEDYRREARSLAASIR